MNLDHLAKAPFNLDQEALDWVSKTYAELTEAERVGQLFNLLSRGDDPDELALIAKYKPGAITRFFGADGTFERERIAQCQEASDVPLLVSADLEGSRMSLAFGTPVPNPLALAAINDLEVTREISAIMAREARAVGVNWSFSPVIDINAAFRSSIVATRGLGSDLETIKAHALTQIEVFQKAGLAATAKHWPGEGHDQRDQHLVTTINPLSMEDWNDTHGHLYRAAIDSGVLAVMSAHIALPSRVYQEDPDAGLEAFRPASVSDLLNRVLLREELGFNGIVVSDASTMAGLTAWKDEHEARIDLIVNGCDMILFTPDLARDLDGVLKAVQSGRITEARLEDAVTRILALKAAMGMHKGLSLGPVSDIGRPEDHETAMAALRRAPTLVKDTQNLLPLDPSKHRRVLILTEGVVEPLMNTRFPMILPDLLAKEGFEVTLYKAGDPIDSSAYDLALYLFAEETLMTRGRIFLDWSRLGGGLRGAMRRLWHEMPVAMISFGYPYYLFDAPRVPTYINAYATMDEMQDVVCDLLLGRGEWNRHNPVDPFSGAPDAAY